MIDVSQWRSSIGLWYSSCQPLYCLRSVKSSTVLGQSTEREQLLSSLIEILLILSGNVELNPGPKTDDVRQILQDVLRENFAVLSDAIKHCVPRTAELMYSSGLISEYTAFDTNNRWSMIDEFNKKMPFKNDVSELHSHCQLFLDCLSFQGGPPLEVAQHLAKIWTERIQQELEISLSFDIKRVQPMETKPSSTSSSKDPVTTAISPQMNQSTYPIMAATSPQMGQWTHPIMAATSPQMGQWTHPIMAATSPQMGQWTHPIMAATSPQMDQSTYPIMAATSPQMDQSTYPNMAATSPQMDQSTHPIMAATSPQMGQSRHPIMPATSPQMGQWTHPIMAATSPQMGQWTHPIMAATSPQMGQWTHPIMPATSPQMGQSTYPIMPATSPQMGQWTHPIMPATSPQMDQSTHPIMAATSPQMGQSRHPIMPATSPQMGQWTHPIMAATSPQMDQLLEWLESLAEWENFAIYLPGMTNDDVEIIKKDKRGTANQKRTLYSKWLEVCPTASWNDVITALERDKKMSLADDVKQKLNEIQNSLTDNRREDISSGTDKHIEFSPQSKDGVAVIINEPIEVKLLPDEEEEIEGSLINLHNKFTRLEIEFKKGLKQFIRNERGTILDIIDYIERYTRSDDAVLRSCTTIDDLMRCINNYYDFLECRVLAETAENFVSPDLACEFRAHLDEAKQFRSSTPVKALREQLHQIYKPHVNNSENVPKARIDLHTVWDDVTIDGLYTLMRKFFSKEDRQSFLKNLKITKSSVHVEYYMTESQDEIKQIIEYCQQNVSIMRYIGIFRLEINGVIILDDQHKDEHTFEHGLLKAAEDGNNEAIQFLVELGIDVNPETEEGQTPLTLAITNGHGHVVETLISAGANVNPQVKWTPLAIAVKKEDPLELTRYLLNHGALCNVLIDGTSILDMTSHEETHQLLYQHNAAMTTQEVIAFRYFELRDKLEELTTNVRKCLNDLLSAGNITLTQVKDQVIDYMSQPAGIMCESVEELLVLLQPFCSVFNVNPLKAVAKKFLGSEIMADSDDYLKNLNDFEMSTKLRHMVHVIGCVASDIHPASSNVTIKLNSQWKNRPLADVHKLLEQCFVSIYQFLTLTDVNEEDSKIVLMYKIPSSPQCSPVISTEQQQFMKQIGICEVIVDDDVILLVNDDDQEMSLELVLQQAVDDNNDSLISFLMDINVTINDKSVPQHGQSSSQPLSESTFKSPNEQLMSAAFTGDNDIVKSLLDRNLIDVNYFNEDGVTPLMIAAENNHPDVVETLLLAGASKLMNHQTSDGWTALMAASGNGHLEVVKCLLTEGVNINVQAIDGVTALMLASENGHLEVVKCLLTEGVDINVQTSNGRTALMAASQNGHFEVVKCLLMEGVNINVQAIDGRTALMLASENGHLEVVKCLLTEGVDVNVQTSDGWTALMAASENGHLEVVKCLLTEGVYINVQTTCSDGWTALMAASENGHLEVVKCLLTEGVDINVQNSDGVTALMAASQNGHLEVVKCLLTEGVDINVQNSDGWTALIFASQNGHLEVVKCLLTEGVDINVLTSNGCTALMAASQNGHLEVFKCLLNKTDDPNIAFEGGFTALMSLCFTSYECIQLYDDKMLRLTLHRIPMIELLLDANASPVVTHSDGRKLLSSLSVAAYCNNLDAVNVLMRRVEFSNELITHAMIAACYVGNPSVINALSHKITNLPHKKLLLSCAEGDIIGVISAIYESNANPDTPLVCGLTPLMVASSCGHIELIDALIQAGADINLPNDYGHTPLDIVDHEYDIRPPNQDVILILVEHGATHKKPVDDSAEILFYSRPNNQSSDDSSVTTQESTKPQMKLPSIMSSIKSYLMNPTRTFKKKHQLHHQTKHIVM